MFRIYNITENNLPIIILQNVDNSTSAKNLFTSSRVVAKIEIQQCIFNSFNNNIRLQETQVIGWRLNINIK
mgnify:FL=1